MNKAQKKNEIIININEANKAQKYQSKEELFQIEAFENVSKILYEHKVSGNLNDITECRFHDTIFIDGDRGVGKTAFMVNIENYYNKYFEAKVENIKDKPKYIFLKSVDPTLLEHTEKFLGVILGKIVEMVSKRLKNNCIDEDDYFVDNNCDRKYKNEKASKNCIDGYYKALENLSKSLSAVSSLENKQDVGIEEIASYKSSQKLEQYAHEFFQVVSTMFGVNAIVMLIDDVDMAFDKGFDVLEVVRKYLASPYLIPIVAGDMKLYREILETKFMDKIDYFKDISTYNTIKNIFDNGCAGDKEINKYWDNSILGCDHQLLIQNRKELKEKKKLINNLVEQYIHKIFPNEYHIKLKDIFSILRENRVQVELKSNLIVPYTEIKDFEIRHINLGINQVQFTYQIFSNNTRDLVQYLFAKKDIYIEFFTAIGDKYSKEAIYKKYIPQNVIENYDNEIFNMIFNKSNLYKKSLDITSIIYEYSQEREEKELYNLTYNDIKSFRNDKYSIYHAFLGKVFENSKLNEEKSYDEIAIYHKEFKDFLSDNKDYNKDYNEDYEMAKYIFNIFRYVNYYEKRAHTKNLVFSGKFLELMFYSFDVNEELSFNDLPDILKNKFEFDELNEKSINEQIKVCKNKIYELMNYQERKEILGSIADKKIKDRLSAYFSEYINGLDEITNKIPFNSIFINNKNFLDTNNYTEEDEDTFIIDYNEKFLSDLSCKILIWRNIYLDDIKISSISIYEITHKFFNNLNLLKAKFNDLKHETPLSFMKRIIYIFINSIAFFVNTNKKVANTNIAIADDFSDNSIKKSLAYVYNIEPLLGTKSLTNALFYHPIIEFILQIDNNDTEDLHILNSLKFIKLINILKELEELGFKSGIGYETRMFIMNEIISKLLNNEYSNSYKKAFLDDKTFNKEFIYFKSNSKGFKDNMNSYKEVVDKLKKYLYA